MPADCKVFLCLIVPKIAEKASEGVRLSASIMPVWRRIRRRRTDKNNGQSHIRNDRQAHGHLNVALAFIIPAAVQLRV